MKYGNKHFSLDETRRDTYKQFHPSVCSPEPPLFSKIGGDMKQLMPVCPLRNLLYVVVFSYPHSNGEREREKKLVTNYFLDSQIVSM